MTKPMSDADAQMLLGSRNFGRLGCVYRGEPYVIPINYLYEDGFVYVHSLPGRKIDALRANPRACLQVDEVEDGCHWRSVVATGTFEEVVDLDQREEILRKLLHRLPLLTPVESLMAEDAGAPEVIVFRICVDRVTSMAEGDAGLIPLTVTTAGR